MENRPIFMKVFFMQFGCINVNLLVYLSYNEALLFLRRNPVSLFVTFIFLTVLYIYVLPPSVFRSFGIVNRVLNPSPGSR